MRFFCLFLQPMVAQSDVGCRFCLNQDAICGIIASLGDFFDTGNYKGKAEEKPAGLPCGQGHNARIKEDRNISKK